MTTGELADRIRTTILGKYEDEFEEFVNKVYLLKYEDRFFIVKASGRHGDFASDGYVSQKLVVQVYAPKKIETNSTITKLQRDFKRAKDHWSFEEWHFVVNDCFEGLPPKVVQKLDELNKKEDIELKAIDASHLQNMITELASTKLMDVYILLNIGDAIVEDFDDFGKLASVVDFVAQLHEVRGADFGFYNFNKKKFYQAENKKIEINIKNDEFKTFFHNAVVISRKVFPKYLSKIGKKYIDTCREYVQNTYEMNAQSFAPEMALMETFNDIFSKISNDHNKKAALWVLIAYFFDLCDIGETNEDGNGQ